MDLEGINGKILVTKNCKKNIFSVILPNYPPPLPEIESTGITLTLRISKSLVTVSNKENRIYIRGEFRQSLDMNFFSPFQSEREFKVYKSCKFSQIICSRVHEDSMFPRLFISIF